MRQRTARFLHFARHYVQCVLQDLQHGCTFPHSLHILFGSSIAPQMALPLHEKDLNTMGAVSLPAPRLVVKPDSQVHNCDAAIPPKDPAGCLERSMTCQHKPNSSGFIFTLQCKLYLCSYAYLVQKLTVQRVHFLLSRA